MTDVNVAHPPRRIIQAMEEVLDYFFNDEILVHYFLDDEGID